MMFEDARFVSCALFFSSFLLYFTGLLWKRQVMLTRVRPLMGCILWRTMVSDQEVLAAAKETAAKAIWKMPLCQINELVEICTKMESPYYLFWKVRVDLGMLISDGILSSLHIYKVKAFRCRPLSSWVACASFFLERISTLGLFFSWAGY